MVGTWREVGYRPDVIETKQDFERESMRRNVEHWSELPPRPFMRVTIPKLRQEVFKIALYALSRTTTNVQGLTQSIRKVLRAGDPTRPLAEHVLKHLSQEYVNLMNVLDGLFAALETDKGDERDQLARRAVHLYDIYDRTLAEFPGSRLKGAKVAEKRVDRIWAKYDKSYSSQKRLGKKGGGRKNYKKAAWQSRQADIGEDTTEEEGGEPSASDGIRAQAQEKSKSKFSGRKSGLHPRRA